MNFDAKVQHILPDSKYPQGRKEGRIRDHFDNPLIAKVLHTSAVGMGFIPVLLTTSKIQSKSPAAARVEINGSYMSNNSLILDIFQRLCHFLRMGMKPFLK